MNACIETGMRMEVYSFIKKTVENNGVRITGEVDRRIQTAVMDLDMGDMMPYFSQFSIKGLETGEAVELKVGKIVRDICEEYKPT